MIIKKWNSTGGQNGDGAWEALYPATKLTGIFASDGTTRIFDSSNKLKPDYLPDFAFGGLRFRSALQASDVNSATKIANELFNAITALAADASGALEPSALQGVYFIASESITVGDFNTTTLSEVLNASNKRFTWSAHSPGEEGSTPSSSLVLEAGDWLVIKSATGDGSSSTPYTIVFSQVNNTYQAATATTAGVVKLGSGDSQSQAPVAVSSTESRTYAVQQYNDGTHNKLVVNVPWVDTNTTYSQATNSALGLLKVSATANTQSLQSVSTESTRQYAVQLDSSGVASVNVPWVDTNTTYSAASDTSLGLIKVSGTANSQTLSSVTTQAGRQYAVQTDTNGIASVNVPWTDTNTTYTAGAGLTLDSTEFRSTYPLYVGTSEPTIATEDEVDNAIWFDL